MENNTIQAETRSGAPLKEHVITPNGGLGAFTEAWRSVLRDFPQSRSLGWRMFVRDTSAIYRQSLLGYVWLVLPAIATSLIWIVLNSQKLVSLETSSDSVPLFIGDVPCLVET